MRKVIIAAWSGLFVLLALSPLARATLLENVPLDSWVYQAVDELQCQGFFRSLNTDVRPYTRGDIAALILEINQGKGGENAELTASQLWLLDKLNQEFRYELEELLRLRNQGAEQVDVFRYGTSPMGHLTVAEGDSSYGRLQIRFEAGIQFGDRLVVKDRVVVDNKADRERSYWGRKWKDNLTGVLDQAYANVDLKYLRLLVGRDHLRWGPGADDVLLLSDHIPPFDMLKAEADFGSFKFVYFTTVLDRIQDPNHVFEAKRYLSGHRLNMKLRFGVQMGLSEVVLYGGENRSPEPYYLNPLLPFYGEQYNNDKDDNILWSFDVTLSTFKNKEIYFELLVDDFQYDFESEPQQTGFQVGLNWAEPVGWERSYAQLEYTKVNDFVYGQIQPWNVYTFHGWGMGSVLGPDADRWFLRLLYHVTRDVDLTFSGERTRKGEGQIQAFVTPTVPYPDKFPSGVVQRTHRYQVGFAYQPSARLKLDLSAGLSRISNFENQEGRKEKTFLLKAQLGINLWKERKL
jgi:hypothetical protein